VKLCPRLPPKKRSNGGARARELGDRARFAAALRSKKNRTEYSILYGSSVCAGGNFARTKQHEKPRAISDSGGTFSTERFSFANAKGRRRAFGSALSRAE
jgi:hypothetical protein